MNKTKVLGLVGAIVVVVIIGLSIAYYKGGISLAGQMYNQKLTQSQLPTPVSRIKSLYRDQTTGISFSYPSSLTVESVYSQPFALMTGFCPVYVHIKLRDPNAHPIELEAGSPQQPWIDINIRKADCNVSPQSNESPNQIQIRQQLPAYQIINPMRVALEALVPVHGDYPNGPNNPAAWVDECQQSPAVITLNKVIVSNRRCLMDGGLALYWGESGARQFFQTKKLVPVNNTIFVEATFGDELFTDTFVSDILSTLSITTITPSININNHQ